MNLAMENDFCYEAGFSRGVIYSSFVTMLVCVVYYRLTSK